MDVGYTATRVCDAYDLLATHPGELIERLRAAYINHLVLATPDATGIPPALAEDVADLRQCFMARPARPPDSILEATLREMSLDDATELAHRLRVVAERLRPFTYANAMATERDDPAG